MQKKMKITKDVLRQNLCRIWDFSSYFFCGWMVSLSVRSLRSFWNHYWNFCKFTLHDPVSRVVYHLWLGFILRYIPRSAPRTVLFVCQSIWLFMYPSFLTVYQYCSFSYCQFIPKLKPSCQSIFLKLAQNCIYLTNHTQWRIPGTSSQFYFDILIKYLFLEAPLFCSKIFLLPKKYKTKKADCPREC